MIQNPAIQGGGGAEISTAMVTINTYEDGYYQTVQDGKVIEKLYSRAVDLKIEALVPGYVYAYGRRGTPTCSGSIENIGYDAGGGIYIVKGEGTIG